MKTEKLKAPGKIVRKQPVSAVPLIQFELKAPGSCSVCIAGTFNDWHPSAAEMVDIGEGHWVKALALPPGVHEYLFVVDGVWCEDPQAMAHVANPFGGRNSVLQVLPK